MPSSNAPRAASANTATRTAFSTRYAGSWSFSQRSGRAPTARQPSPTKRRASPAQTSVRRPTPARRRTGRSSRTSERIRSSFVIGRPHDELADLLVAAVSGELDRALREAGLGRDLGDGPALELEEPDDLALLLREQGQDALHEQRRA